MQTFGVEDDIHLISLGEKMPIYKHSGQWHLFCYIKLLISTSFQSQSTLFWELFKWENICNLSTDCKTDCNV